jgi:nucleoside-diphosphate-sugar epimerase
MSGHPADDVRPVLVTGAAGFLGSHLCDRLLERGLAVIGLDDLSAMRASASFVMTSHRNYPMKYAASVASSTWPARPVRRTTSNIR